MLCTFELFGMARHLAGVAEVEVELPEGASVRDALRALAQRHPVLIGRAVAEDGETLASSHIISLEGRTFLTDLSTPLADGQRLLVMPAAVGGIER